MAVATGLAAATGTTCLVLACDLPFAGPLLTRLLAAPGPGAVVAVDAGGRAQPLCARYPREEALAACERLLRDGVLAAGSLVEALRARGLPARGDELLNVNTLDELARAEAIVAQAGRTSTTAL